MFEAQLAAHTKRQTDSLLGGAGEIPFKDLIQRDLPSYLYEYLNVTLNPLLGGLVRIGNMELDFGNPDVKANLEDRLMGELTIERAELERVLDRALAMRLQFILDPCTAIAAAIFERQPADTVPSGDVRVALETLMGVVKDWNPKIAQAVAVVAQYLGGQPGLRISDAELTRILRPAVEKDFSVKVMPTIEATLLVLKELVEPDGVASAERIDYTDAMRQLLQSRGLGSWMAALEVERELMDGILNPHQAINALRRLNLYRERGVIGAEREDLLTVDDEIRGFTSFAEGER